MSLFRDRKDRYLLPMLAPAAIITARAVLEHFETRHTRNAADRAVVAAHWVTLLVIAVGLPIVGATILKTVDGTHWYSPGLAAAAAGTGAAVVAAGVVAHRRHDFALVVTTVVLMLAVQALIVHGYRNAREGRSEMKPLAAVIWERYPHATVAVAPHRKGHAPPDLPIYLNRPIHRAADPSSPAPAAGNAQIMVARQDARDPEPSFAPPWKPIGKVRRDNSWWHAFVREPVSATTTASSATSAASPR
jgi:hypothetical protein